MRTVITGLLKGRKTRWGMLVAAIAAVAATVAWSSDSQVLAKLEGAWIGNTDNGIRGLAIFCPSDPSGRTAAFRYQMVVPPENLAALGVDAFTDEIGESVVTGPTTGKYNGIWYGLVGGRIVTIFLDNSSFTLVSRTQLTIDHTVSVYLAAADADHDGYPDPGSTPVAVLTAHTVSKRLTN